MGNVVVPQSLPICGGLAATGGILEVFATAVMAYPAARVQEGIEWTDGQLRWCLVCNLIFQILASLAGNLFATWYGPVSIVGPLFFAAQLVANLFIFWIVLGLEHFTKDMQIGTYIIVLAVTLLLRVGPSTQDNQNFVELITQPWALGWSILLLLGMFYTAIYVLFLDMTKAVKSMSFRIFILLLSRSTAFALNLSAGRALILKAGTTWIVITTIVKVVSGIIYTKAIVVQSTAVSQAVFVPLNAATIMLVNAITGIIIWEDYKVMRDWTGYVCVFLLLAIGCVLLLGDLLLLGESDPKAFRANFQFLRGKGRRQIFDTIKAYAKDDDDMDDLDYFNSNEHRIHANDDDVEHITPASFMAAAVVAAASLHKDDNASIDTEADPEKARPPTTSTATLTDGDPTQVPSSRRVSSTSDNMTVGLVGRLQRQQSQLERQGRNSSIASSGVVISSGSSRPSMANRRQSSTLYHGIHRRESARHAWAKLYHVPDDNHGHALHDHPRYSVRAWRRHDVSGRGSSSVHFMANRSRASSDAASTVSGPVIGVIDASHIQHQQQPTTVPPPTAPARRVVSADGHQASSLRQSRQNSLEGATRDGQSSSLSKSKSTRWNARLGLPLPPLTTIPSGGKLEGSTSDEHRRASLSRRIQDGTGSGPNSGRASLITESDEEDEVEA